MHNDAERNAAPHRAHQGAFRGDRLAAYLIAASVLVAPGLLGGGSHVGEAQARDRDRVAMPPNAAQQRKDMIERLEAIEKSLEKIERGFANGLEVRVSNFPAPEQDDDKQERDR